MWSNQVENLKEIQRLIVRHTLIVCRLRFFSSRWNSFACVFECVLFRIVCKLKFRVLEPNESKLTEEEEGQKLWITFTNWRRQASYSKNTSNFQGDIANRRIRVSKFWGWKPVRIIQNKHNTNQVNGSKCNKRGKS